MSKKLTSKQVELLYEAKKTEDPVVVSREDLNAAKEVLGAGLADVDPSEVSLAALAERYDASGDGLAQMPATGGPAGDGPISMAADGDADVALSERLSHADVMDLRQEVKKMEMFRDRDMNKRADELATEACEIAGVEDIDEIDRDGLLE